MRQMRKKKSERGAVGLGDGERGGEEVRYVRGANWPLNSGGVNRQVTQVSSAAISSLLSPLLFGFLHPRVERRRGIQR